MKFFILLSLLAALAVETVRAQENTFPIFPSQLTETEKKVIFTRPDGSQFVSYDGSPVWYPVAGTTSPNPTPPWLRKQGAGGRRIVYTRSNGEKFSSYDGRIWRRETSAPVQRNYSTESNGAARSTTEADNKDEARVLGFTPTPPGGQATVRYYLPAEEHVVFSLMNGSGEEMLRVVDVRQTPGIHSAEFNTSGLKPGVYFYHFTVGRVIFSGTVPIVQ